MTDHYLELAMYTAPDNVQQANEAWLQRIHQLLGGGRQRWDGRDLRQLWRAPQLLLTQTCGYPLMQELREQVRVLGRPVYRLADAQDGWHCSLLLVRHDAPREDLAALRGSRAVINGFDSNTGMNLLRHSLLPLQRDGRFFAEVRVSGAHRASLRQVADGQAELTAVDSVTFAYLAAHAPAEVAEVRVLARSAPSPTLPYIGARGLDAQQGETIRAAMNQALLELPDVARILGIEEVQAARAEDYQVLLDYQEQAERAGYAELA